MIEKIIFALLVLILSGCSVTPIPSTPNKENTQLTFRRDIGVVDLNNRITLAAIIPQLARSKAVLVGETHTHYGDHLNQLAIIKNLRPHWDKMAIGLEFIQYPYQKVLDDYILGKISQNEMLLKTEWYDRWKYDFPLYRPIFEYAKQQQIPLIALNAPQEITRRISEVGIKGLSKKERQQLPDLIDVSNKKYKKVLEAVYQRHGGKSRSKKFERFYQAQLAWDETMADQAAKFMLKHPNYKMVILAGSGHIKGRHGIPSRLQRRIKSKPMVVLNGVDDNPNPSQADYLVFSEDAQLPKIGKMGIFMKKSAQGILISKVFKGSASASAGLKKGDVITGLNGEKIKTIGQIKIKLMDTKPKQRIVLTLRNKQQKSFSRTLILQ